MKNIAIFTTFNEYDLAYSLCSVTSDQIKMLLGGGYSPKVFVTEHFKPAGIFEKVELRRIPSVLCSNEGHLPDDYETQVDLMEKALTDFLQDIDVCMAHDIIYQPAHLIHNIAARRVALKYPKLRWLHWIHSATSPNILCNRNEVKEIIQHRFPNSFFVYPNSYDIPRVARNYNIEEMEIKCVNHPIDICEYFGFHPLTRELVEEKNILAADLICCYPLRMDRGKQPDIVMKIFAEAKKMGKSVRLIFCDFHSTGKHFQEYKDEILNIAAERGLNLDEIVFTSRWKKELELSCPREMVRDLMLISNVFILPSRSETYSLIAQEAAMCGNFIILNGDFPPMRSVYGSYPKYFQFSSNINALTGYDGETNTRYGNERAYWSDIVRYIDFELRTNRILGLKDMLRKERNLKTVFKNQLEPLLYA